MKPISLSNLFLLPIFLVALKSEYATAKDSILANSSHITAHQILPTSACRITYFGTQPRILLQVNGSVDDIVTFSVCPVLVQLVPNVTLLPSSTNPEILITGENSDVDLQITTLSSSPCLNITALLSFNKMVGKTTFILSARDPLSNLQSCATQVDFIIAGFTIFEEIEKVQPFASSQRGDDTLPLVDRVEIVSGDNSFVTRRIVSGIGNEVVTNYRENLFESVRAYNMKVQYPNGSDSISTSRNALENDLKNIQTKVSLDATSPVQLNTSECNLVQNELERSLKSNPDCGAAFSIENQDGETGASFGLRYEPYRDGLVNIMFEWDSFTQNNLDLQEEQYVNYMQVNVGGDPPPIIIDFEPKDAFRRAGGEVVTVTLDNVNNATNRTLKVGGQEFSEVPGTFRRLENGLYTVQYRTQPGNGTELDWVYSVADATGEVKSSEIVGDQVNETISYITQNLNVEEVDPPFVKDGDKIKIRGYFDGFNLSNDNHDILLGSQSVSTLGIDVEVLENGSCISMVLPSRSEIGEAYEYDIQVTVNNESTNFAQVVYTPPELNLTIDVYGASFQAENDRYALGSCDFSSFFAVLPSGVTPPDEFLWELINMSPSNEGNVLSPFSDVSNSEQVLLLPPKVFGSSTGLFQLTVMCTVYDQDLEATIILEKTSPPIVGVELPNIRPRSIAVPDVPLRVVASVSIPNPACFNSSGEVMYEWTYKTASQQFSYLNRSIEPFGSIATPTKLGREFVIPQSILDYGNVTISLRAYMKESTNVGGVASINVEIRPAEVVPVIGYGASLIKHVSSRDLRVTGIQSYSRDRSFLRNSPNFDFEWSCFISTSAENISQSPECSVRFLPNPKAKSFTISAGSLMRYRNQLQSNGLNGTFYLQYSLKVMNSGNSDNDHKQTIEVSSTGTEIASLDALNIVDNKGIALERSDVPYYLPMTIIPIGDDLEWTFDVISMNGSNILKSTDVALLYPGYYNPFDDKRFQNKPLGLRAGVLASAKKYEIVMNISSKNPSITTGKVRFSFRTRDEPKLVLTDLIVTSGNQETLFPFFASVNLDTTHDFQYHFFAISDNETEICLDGCSGRPSIYTRLPILGTYRILVRLMDINGNTVFDESFYEQNITISVPSEEKDGLNNQRFTNLFQELKYVHRQGDHGTLHLLSSFVPEINLDADESSLQENSETFHFTVDVLDQMAQNSPVNTVTAQNIVQLASRLIVKSTKVLGTQKLIRSLASVVDHVISQIPIQEALNFQNDLLLFYNLSLTTTLNQLPQSNIAERQVKFEDDGNLNFSTLLVDLYRLQNKHLVTFSSRSIICGETITWKSDVEQGMPLITNRRVSSEDTQSLSRQTRESFDILSTYGTVSTPNHSVFTMASLCLPKQLQTLSGEGSNFQWCSQASSEAGSVISDDVTFDPTHRVLVTLYETPDYLSESSLLNTKYKSDTFFLVSINFTMARGEELKQVSIPQNFDCFLLRSSIPRLGMTPNKGCLSAEGYSVQYGAPALSTTDDSENIIEDVSIVKANMSLDRSSTVTIRTSTLGIFGAIALNCPVSARKPTLNLPSEDAEFVYLIFGGAAVAAVGVGVAWTASTSSYAAATGTAAAAG